MIDINFKSSKDTDQERVKHPKSDNIEIMINDKAGEVVKEPFESPLSRYQIGSENLMKPVRGGGFIFVYLFYFKCHK